MKNQIINILQLQLALIHLLSKTLQDGPFQFVGKGECVHTIENLIRYCKKEIKLDKVPGLYYFSENKKKKYCLIRLVL